MAVVQRFVVLQLTKYTANDHNGPQCESSSPAITMPPVTPSLVQASQHSAGVAEECLAWSAPELDRLQALKHEVFFDAVRELSVRAASGSSVAFQSAQNGFQIATPEAWLTMTEVDFSSKESLMDCVGHAMKHDFMSACDAVMPRLEAHFRGGRTSGPWNGFSMNSSFGPGNQAGLFANDAPLAQLLVCAVHFCRDEDALLALFNRVGKWSEWPNTFVSKPNWFEYSPSWPSRITGFTGNLIGQSALADNPVALRALRRWDPEAYRATLPKEVARGSQRYTTNTSPYSALTVAAISNSTAALEQLLSDGRDLLANELRMQLVAQASLDHLKQTGLRDGNAQEVSAHDRQVGVWGLLSSAIKGPLLDSVADLATEDAMSKERLRNTGGKGGTARSMFSLVCDIVVSAVERAHPEAIKDCLVAINHGYALRMGERSREDGMWYPFNYVMGALAHRPGVTQSTIDRLTSAFEPNIRERDMKVGGEETLLTSAKQGNMLVCTHLVTLGVDPATKDERGWNATSYFKAEHKQEWSAFVAARRAKQQMSAIANAARNSAGPKP